MLITDFFKIVTPIDFYNIDVDNDIQCYFDPYLVLNNNGSDKYGFREQINSFFTEVVNLHSQNYDITPLFQYFGEQKTNHLGMSKQSINGKGSGMIFSKVIADELSKMLNDFQGIFNNFDELTLFIFGVGNDRISDMTTALCIEQLIVYTKNQLSLHGLNVLYTHQKHQVWNSSSKVWEEKILMFPLINGRATVLTPNMFCKSTVSMKSFGQFIQLGVLGYLKDNYKQYGIAPGKRKDKKGNYIDTFPTKKSIIEFFKSKGTLLNDKEQFVKCFTSEEIISMLEYYKNQKKN